MKDVPRVFAALFFLVAGSLHATAQRQVSTKLNAYIDRLHQQGDFSGNILVADRGKVLLERAVGDADAFGAVKLDLADRFEIGSIAKEFDSVGLLILKEQGRLALTDPVSQFLPDLPPWASTITIDQLLHYTSGLPKPDFNVVHSDAENWLALKTTNHLDFTPGVEYRYNNNDVFLRRRVIEKVSGMSFAAFVEARELPPAGIRHAVIDPSDDTPHVAKSFSADGKQDKLIAPISGWVSLSLADLLQWSRCIDRFCLISPESTRLIARTDGPNRQSGLGTADMQGDTVIRHVHDGSLLHYRALLLTKADTDRTILILGNRRPPDIYAMAAAIEAILDSTPQAPKKH